MSSDRFIDGKRLVLDAADIVRLIGETVRLKRSGRNYTGLCPFHNEKTPSFSVNAEKQFFHCFGCKKSGNAIDFVMERDRLEFRDALEALAEWAGVDLPRASGPPGAADRRRTLFDACAAAAAFFRSHLASEAGTAAREYLAGRGFSRETVDRFGLGLSPGGWDGLLKGPVGRKFGVDVLVEAGLAKRRETEGQFDFFRDRVMFPIRDEQGRTVAFGGRVLPGDDSPAKYLNSPETPLFSKSRVLYGLDVARQAVVKSGRAVVLEGYADVAAAHQHGADNTVCVLGTSLTSDHVRVLRRFCDEVVLLFDADAAGDAATRRAVELFLGEPVDLKIARLPDGLDPDEFLARQGPAGWQRVMDDATDVLAYLWSSLRASTGGTGDGVTRHQKAGDAFVRLLAEARKAGHVDPARWGPVVARVAKLTGLPPDELTRRLSGENRPPSDRPSDRRDPAGRREASARKFNPRFPPKPLTREAYWAAPRAADLNLRRSADSADTRSQAALLGALFDSPALWRFVQDRVGPDAFTDPRYAWLAGVFWDHVREEGEPSFPEWLDVVSARLAEYPDKAASARSTCVTLRESAAELGDVRRVAADALEFLLTHRRRLEARKVHSDLADATPADEELALRRLQELKSPPARSPPPGAARRPRKPPPQAPA